MARFTTDSQLRIDSETGTVRSAVTTRPTTQPPGVRENKYAGPCTVCGGRVEAKAGRIDKVNDRWQVSHIVCPEKQAAESTGIHYTVLDGVYTVLSPEGHHRTFKIRTQDPDADFMAGAQVLAYLSGPDNSHDYTRFAHLDVRTGKLRVWRRFQEANTLIADAELFLADPEAALQMAHCRRCHRELTRPDSIDRGLGSDCAKK